MWPPPSDSVDGPILHKSSSDNGGKAGLNGRNGWDGLYESFSFLSSAIVTCFTVDLLAASAVAILVYRILV